MGIKDILSNKISLVNGTISSLCGSIEYIEEYGHVGLYDNNITEDFLNYKMLEAISALEKADKILEEIVDIVCDQYQY
jgi:hypothetical protein